MKSYSTSQVAQVLKIGRQTLHRWMADGYVSAPPRRKVGGVTVRIWSVADVERVRKYKRETYRKGRGRKPKLKQ
jgi:predicted DNA-binding transcriptional regulator AlpA